MTTDACDKPTGQFGLNEYTFVPTQSPWNLRFEFITGERDAVMKVDKGAYRFFQRWILLLENPLYDLRDGVS